MRIFDTFLFRDELDILECRLIQFDQYPVYRHVLVEAPVDHRGHPKPLVYAENKERFAPWADRIIHVVADELAQMGGPSEDRDTAWAREAAQREAIGRGLTDANPDDRLILADVDEIPNAAAIQHVQEGETGVFDMVFCLFAVDWVWDNLRTSVTTCVGDVTSFKQARREIWGNGPVFPDCGYHLSWLGGLPGVQAKLAATCHTEVVAGTVAALGDGAFYRDGVNLFDSYVPSLRTGSLLPVDVDERWPKWVYERLCPPEWFRPR